MNNKLDNTTACLLLKAVLHISNSTNEPCSDLNYKYKSSISYVYLILSIIYLEKIRALPDKLHKQINHTTSNTEFYLFKNVLDFQLNTLGIKKYIFSAYKTELNNEHFLELIKILKKIISLPVINIELLGYLYEYFQQYQLEKNNSDNSNALQLKLNLNELKYKYIIIHSDLAKKKQGSFFTPPYLIDKLITAGLTEKLNQITSLSDLLSFKVLDPACGAGNILLQVFYELYEKALQNFNQSINPEGLKKLILKNCIFGADIDDFACEITKLILFLASGKFEHFENIANGNFLMENLEGYSKNIDTSKFFKNNPSEFSLIIGNPPYLNIQNIDEIEKKYYLDNYLSAYRRFDIYLLFIEKSLQSFLKKDGILAFIIPDKFLTQSYAKKCRQLILKNHSIKEIINFNKLNLFSNASVSPIIITINTCKNTNNDIKISEIFEKTTKNNFINQNSYLDMHDFTFRIGWNVYKQEIIEQIQSKSFPLHKLCYISWGAQPGNAKKFIFNNIDQVAPENKKYLKPLIRGGNLDRYTISYTGDYLLYLTEGDLKLHRPALAELFESKKIVIAEVSASKGIVACLDNEKFYTNHSIINCIHKKDLLEVNQNILNSRGIKIFDETENIENKWHENHNAYTRGGKIYRHCGFNNICLNYAMSIINSRLINFYFKNFLSGNLNVFPELIKFLPIFDIGLVDQNNNFEHYQSLINNNDFEKIKNILENLLNNNNYSDIHSIFSLITDKLINLKLNLNTSGFLELDNILDNAIFKLYGLNDNQINFIKNE